jgi:ribosome assembly protein YihI (activator of Der GTPase)
MTRNSEVEAPRSGQLTDQSLQAENQEPRTPSEKYMASLWSEIIGLDQVMLPHKFLEVGGNSLTLNIILNRIETEKGVSPEAQLFFDDDRSSLFELAKELDLLLEKKTDHSQ